MPIVTTSVFQTSEAAYADLGHALSRLDTKAWRGFLGAWAGRNMDDKLAAVEAHIVFAWDSLEAHNAAQSNPSNLEFVTNRLKPCLADSLSQASTYTLQLTTIEKNAIAVFDSPLTEVLLLKLKDGRTKDELDVVEADMVSFLLAHDIQIRLPCVDGEVLDSTGAFELYTAIGWDGLEAYQDALKVEGTVGYAAKFFELADVAQAWVKFERRV